MGKSLLKRVTSLFAKAETRANQPDSATNIGNQPISRTRINEATHGLSRKYLDDNAMKVVYGLSDKGHEAYLVGGCIRDLLLGEKPKDFDVATSAEPEVAHSVFKRSRLIGRRFKLLHVRFGREIIEVATFRAGHDSQSKEGEHGRQNSSGMITRDNVYGTLEEDAERRDFTANALYYDGNEHCIYDFCGGYEDIKNRTLKIIGNPVERYREDPVRMLRAARFAGKLGFTVEPRTAEPIFKLGYLLKDIAPARLFDESLKLFQSGYGEKAFHSLQTFELFAQLYPDTQRSLEGP
ncbi:MAG: polynucleotide adenylyltransferase PcnB, partial [Pontibacterium sp.]